jgi:hypothetical protein
VSLPLPSGDGGADDEAEYAWLPTASLKAFRPGDVTGNEDGIVSGDPVLAASVAAAEGALRAAAGGVGGGRGRGGDGDSDSDGGWGISREVCGGRMGRVWHVRACAVSSHGGRLCGAAETAVVAY